MFHTFCKNFIFMGENKKGLTFEKLPFRYHGTPLQAIVYEERSCLKEFISLLRY